MFSAAKIATYCGLVFATLDPDAVPFEEYLGRYRWYLDIQLKLTPGGMEVLGEPHRWVVDANWKQGAENFCGDSSHTQMTHRSAIEAGLVDAAKLLAAAGPYLPPFMQANVGACLANCMRAQELGVSPLALARWTYVVEQYIGGQKVEQIAYESQMFHAVVEANAPITTRLQVSYEGEGDSRRCRVWATFKGEKEPRYFPPLDAAPYQFTLGKLRPKRNESGRIKGSPLDSQPAANASSDSRKPILAAKSFPPLGT